jgi:hypothetical protein
VCLVGRSRGFSGVSIVLLVEGIFRGFSGMFAVLLLGRSRVFSGVLYMESFII